MIVAIPFALKVPSRRSWRIWSCLVQNILWLICLWIVMVVWHIVMYFVSVCVEMEIQYLTGRDSIPMCATERIYMERRGWILYMQHCKTIGSSGKKCINNIQKRYLPSASQVVIAHDLSCSFSCDRRWCTDWKTMKNVYHLKKITSQFHTGQM